MGGSQLALLKAEATEASYCTRCSQSSSLIAHLHAMPTNQSFMTTEISHRVAIPKWGDGPPSPDSGVDAFGPSPILNCPNH